MDLLYIGYLHSGQLFESIEKNIDETKPKFKNGTTLITLDMSVDADGIPRIGSLSLKVEDASDTEQCLKALRDLAFRLVNRQIDSDHTKSQFISLKDVYTRIGLQVVANCIGDVLTDIALTRCTIDENDMMWEMIHQYRDAIDVLVQTYNDGGIYINTDSLTDDTVCTWVEEYEIPDMEIKKDGEEDEQ